MTGRTSRLISDLEASIKTAKDVFAADCLRADLAAQFAQIGRKSDAATIISSLKERYRTCAHERVSLWIMFADSILDLRSGESDDALLKMRRAHALSSSGAGGSLTALAAAWLAHMYWERQDIELVVRHLDEALKLSSASDHRARWRASLVFAEVLALSGERVHAETWFASARHHATKTGDDAAMSALSFNAASVQIAALKQLVFDQQELDGSPRSAIVRNAVSRALDELLNIPRDDMSLLQQAQVLSLQNSAAAALEIYQGLHATTIASRSRRWGEWLSDEAWCYARLGMIVEGQERARDAQAAIESKMHLDDLACAHSRLALVFTATGDYAEASTHRVMADKYWTEYRDFQHRCVTQCEPIVARFDVASFN